MSSHREPNIILLRDYDDANTVVAGVLSLKGCKVHKTENAESCLALVNELRANADAVLIKKEIALSGEDILGRIKKLNPDIITIALTDNMNNESTLYNVTDEIVQTPVSAENLADKILMLLAKKELRKARETRLKNDPIE